MYRQRPVALALEDIFCAQSGIDICWVCSEEPGADPGKSGAPCCQCAKDTRCWVNLDLLMRGLRSVVQWHALWQELEFCSHEPLTFGKVTPDSKLSITKFHALHVLGSPCMRVGRRWSWPS